MDKLREFFRQMLDQEAIQITLSGTRDQARATKVKLRPVRIGGELCFQETLCRGAQEFHSNHGREEASERLSGYMGDLFRQAQAVCAGLEATALVSKKGTVTIKTKKRTEKDGERKRPELSHDRAKHYILREGEPADFLVSLGVQTPEGGW